MKLHFMNETNGIIYFLPYNIAYTNVYYNLQVDTYNMNLYGMYHLYGVLGNRGKATNMKRFI